MLEVLVCRRRLLGTLSPMSECPSYVRRCYSYGFDGTCDLYTGFETKSERGGFRGFQYVYAFPVCTREDYPTVTFGKLPSSVIAWNVGGYAL